MIVSPLAYPRPRVAPKPACSARALEDELRRLRPHPEPRARTLAMVALVAALTVAPGCASRSVPQHFPEQAAASPAAQAAPAARVTRALAADLPLPGEPGAEALESDPQPGAAPHAQHGAHHHGH